MRAQKVIKEADRLVEEGRRLQEQGAPAEALPRLERAVALLDEVEAQLLTVDSGSAGRLLLGVRVLSLPAAHSALAVVFQSLGRSREALDHFEAVLLGHHFHDRPRWNGVVRHLRPLYEGLPAEEAVMRLEPVVKEASGAPLDSEGTIRLLQGEAHLRLGRAKEAADLFRRARGLLGRAEDGRWVRTPEEEAWAKEVTRLAEVGLHEALGTVHVELGELEEALEEYRQALEIRIEMRDRVGQGVVYRMLGVACERLGRFDDAREHLLHALDLARQAGMREEEGRVLGLLGAVHRGLGLTDEAAAYVEEAEAIRRDAPAGPGSP
ncbi:MAG: tetratricopeptide repeat protein [Actinobacteria bacterium]|nr:tetratricopeptide repeat protein [Actinomycetota bacterium]